MERIDLSADQVGNRSPAAAVGNMDHVDAGHHLEHLAGYMERGSVAGRRKVKLARIGLGVGDELGNGLGRDRRVYHHDFGLANEACDRCDVADEIEIEFVVERNIDCVG